MRIAIFGKNIADDNMPYLRDLLEMLQERRVEVSVFAPLAPCLSLCAPKEMTINTFANHDELVACADFLFSIGGDGTILDAVPLLRDSGIPVLGINMGRLGFLSSIAKEDLHAAVDELLEGHYTLDDRSLLELVSPQGVFNDEINYALNEINIIRNPEHSLLAIKVFVNDTFLNTYWGDGILLATPTGSTAYSLSAGGPILTPDSKNFVITPIAAHNLTVRPIVIPDDTTVRIHVEGRENKFVFSMDSRTCALDTSIELVVRKAHFTIRRVQMADSDFFSTIRQKLMWGKDNRN